MPLPRCCRCRAASRWWSGPRASSRPSRCSRSPSGRASRREVTWLFFQAVVSGLLLGGVYGLVASGAVLIALALWAFLRMTDAGKAIRALSEEAEGAMLVGIDVSRIRGVAFGIGSACVAVAGALVTPFFYVAPDVGESFNIMAFVVVVLGGMGNFLGALLGGFIVGLAESLGAAFLPGSLKQLVVFGLFVIVLLLRPEGLFGARRGR